eukprot:g55192.t1
MGNDDYHDSLIDFGPAPHFHPDPQNRPGYIGKNVGGRGLKYFCPACGSFTPLAAEGCGACPEPLPDDLVKKLGEKYF